MALKKCSECGAKVSTRATACPSCGAPVKAKENAIATAGCGCLILIVFAVICAGIIPSPSDDKEEAAAPAAPLTPEQEARRDAEEKAAREKQKANLDRFLALLSEVGIDNSIIDSVAVSGDTATITMSNTWHLMPYQIRLQGAQNLWKLWASIASPRELDKARISLVDFNDNEVGGSRILAGSLIWVQEN